jgi:hypothetical protein
VSRQIAPAVWLAALRFDAPEKRLVRARAGDDVGADLIRAIVINRVNNEVCGPSVANQ